MAKELPLDPVDLLPPKIIDSPGQYAEQRKREYKPEPGKNKVIRQERKPFWTWFDLFQELELVSVEWIKQFSIENEGGGERTVEEQTEIGLTITQGQEHTESVSASAGFSGWGFSVNIDGKTERKTFSTVETSKVHTRKDIYRVPAHTSIFVYKKKYTFRGKLWLGGWAPFSFGGSEPKPFFVGPNGTTRSEANYEISIIAAEELITGYELREEGTVVVEPPNPYLSRPPSYYSSVILKAIYPFSSLPWL